MLLRWVFAPQAALAAMPRPPHPHSPGLSDPPRNKFSPGGPPPPRRPPRKPPPPPPPLKNPHPRGGRVGPKRKDGGAAARRPPKGRFPPDPPPFKYDAILE